MADYYIFMILAGIMSLIGFVVQQRLKSKFKHYSKVPVSSGETGAEIAKDMLRHFELGDEVKVVEGKGYLTDHYNPKTKTISLSPEVYRGRSVASAAVASHECGHAVQHAKAYAPLKLRSTIVPVVQVAASLQQWLLIIALGAFGTGMPGGSTILLVTIIVFGVTTAFSLITLPVEFDASNRALKWLDSSGFAVTGGKEYKGAKDALWWAAMTYVAAALSALVLFFYLILRYVGSR